MICFRCGSDVPEASPQCPNCGQRFAGAKRTFTTTTTSFRALEKRRLRAVKAAETLPFGIGDVVGSRYEVRDLVGRGPLGIVYRVHDQEIEVDVALKVFDETLLESEADREGFRRTVRKVRKLSQQNIVRLYDDGQDGERLFFTMQLLEGLTLRKVIGLRQEKGSRFTAREIEPILGQICMALSHAHRHTVHGDLKPENVIILPDVLKLTDFGAHEAIPIERYVAAQTEVGAAGYLAPELIAGKTVDARADVYSLGALLYELLTGRAFAPGLPPPSAVLEQPAEAGPGGVDAIVSRATAADPADRYESAEAFSEALSTYVDSRELGSIDASAAPSLLPEDVTRKVKAPAGLQDEPEPATEPWPKLVDAAPEAPAERSMVEELDGEDLDALIEATESADVRAPIVPIVPEAPAAPPQRTYSGPPAAAFDRDATPIGAAAAPPKKAEPWFLRSNIGFLLAVIVLVGGVLAATLYLIDMLRERGQPLPPRIVQVESGPAVESEPAIIVAEAVPSAPATEPPPPATEPPAPATAPPAPETVAAVRPAPATEAPRPAPATEAARPAPAPPSRPAPASVAERPVPAPASRPAPVSAVAERPTPPPAPATAAARPTPPPAPVSVAAAGLSAAASEAEPEALPAPAASAGGGLACPAGTIVVTTAAFPKGSVKGGKITGAEAVALAKSGKAYCIDAHEFPGRGMKPRTSVTFTAAEGLCKGAGKRLCTDAEWTRACRGPGGAAFPYGSEFSAARCNTEDEAGDERNVDAAGKFSKCRSAVGAYDMSGNAAEWTADQTVRGGDAAASDDEASCAGGGRRAPGTARPGIGFRCCADPR